MWSSGNIDLGNVDLVLDHKRMIENVTQFQPIPYTFKKLENGKKKTTDETCTPPCWLLLDHTIAVVWLMFNLDAKMQPLSIDDLKWAYEFLKRIKNQRGENPPDVKVCLKEIQDRLIYLYASLTPPQSVPEDIAEIDEALGENLMEGSTTSYINSSYYEKKVESKVDSMSLSSTKNQVSLVSKESGKETGKVEKERRETFADVFPLIEEDSSDVCEEETCDEVEDEEVEKYVLSLFEHEKKEEALRAKSPTKSLIPTAKKTTTPNVSEVVSSQDVTFRGTKREKNSSKKVHCIAQMRSLQFKKSTKVKHGEQEAYSKLKAEILTINPNSTKEGVMNFLKDWKTEQVNKLHREHKKLSSIEEYMKCLNDEVTPNFKMNTQIGLKEVKTAKCTRRLLP